MVLSASKSLFLVIFTSLLLWLSFPGGGEIWPLLPVALVPVLYVIRRVNVRRAVFYGFIGGLVHFILLFYWIYIAVEHYGGVSWYIASLAVVLLASYMSLYFALFAGLARYLLLTFPAAISLWLIPALWVGIDWLRGVLFTGFPWMDLGYALYKVPLLIQIADLVGHHGVSFLLVFVNTLLLLACWQKRSVLGILLLVLPAFCLLTAIAIYSKTRLEDLRHQVSTADVPRVSIGIVQGNIDQGIKWSSLQQKATVDKYLLLTRDLLASDGPSIVVWPEAALPFFPPINPSMHLVWEQVTDLNFALLTGAPWVENVIEEPGKLEFFNSALLLQPDGSYGGIYHKTHLVPFGEYVPLRRFLPFLEPFVKYVGDLSQGMIERPLVWQYSRMGLLICYESIFPELSRKWVLAGANVLVNLANDAWYGKSSAAQHNLAMSVLRAVETRRSLVRSANTGISAFIAPTGMLSRSSELFITWSAAEQVVLMEGQTVWVRYGYLFAPICLVFGLMGGLVAGMRRRWR